MYIDLPGNGELPVELKDYGKTPLFFVGFSGGTFKYATIDRKLIVQFYGDCKDTFLKEQTINSCIWTRGLVELK